MSGVPGSHGSHHGGPGSSHAPHGHHPHQSSAALLAQEKERYIEKFEFPFCARVDKYEKIAKIGQGTFGEVFKARCRTDRSKIVALKKVLMELPVDGAQSKTVIPILPLY